MTTYGRIEQSSTNSKTSWGCYERETKGERYIEKLSRRFLRCHCNDSSASVVTRGHIRSLSACEGKEEEEERASGFTNHSDSMPASTGGSATEQFVYNRVVVAADRDFGIHRLQLVGGM